MGITNWCVTLIHQVEHKKGVTKERTVLEDFSGTKHTKHGCFVKHFLQINRKNKSFKIYICLFSFIFIVIITIIVIIIIIIIIDHYHDYCY